MDWFYPAWKAGKRREMKWNGARFQKETKKRLYLIRRLVSIPRLSRPKGPRKSKKTEPLSGERPTGRSNQPDGRNTTGIT